MGREFCKEFDLELFIRILGESLRYFRELLLWRKTWSKIALGPDSEYPHGDIGIPCGRTGYDLAYLFCTVNHEENLLPQFLDNVKELVLLFLCLFHTDNGDLFFLLCHGLPFLAPGAGFGPALPGSRPGVLPLDDPESGGGVGIETESETFPNRELRP